MMTVSKHKDIGVEAAPPDYKAIAITAVDLLCTLGCYGLHSSKQRELWQRALDLDRKLHPDRAPVTVWTQEEGDAAPPRKETAPG
jgi:hypothetical protein